MSASQKKAKGWRPFEEARAFAQTLGLTSKQAWEQYCRSGHKPHDIPAHPELIYKGHFLGYGNWLGSGRIANQKRVYWPFEKARAFVHTLGLKSQQE
jgi:hypothetical protein